MFHLFFYLFFCLFVFSSLLSSTASPTVNLKDYTYKDLEHGSQELHGKNEMFYDQNPERGQKSKFQLTLHFRISTKIKIEPLNGLDQKIDCNCTELCTVTTI